MDCLGSQYAIHFFPYVLAHQRTRPHYSQIRIRHVYRPLIVAPRGWQGQDGFEGERLVFVGVGSWGMTSNYFDLSLI